MLHESVTIARGLARTTRNFAVLAVTGQLDLILRPAESRRKGKYRQLLIESPLTTPNLFVDGRTAVQRTQRAQDTGLTDSPCRTVIGTRCTAGRVPGLRRSAAAKSNSTAVTPSS
jgi:hypothetical protein